MGKPYSRMTDANKKVQRDYYRDVWYPKNRARHQAVTRRSLMKRRQQVIDYKLEKGCTDCGYNKDAWALEFDHLGDKAFVISRYIQSYSWARLENEIAKCEVVCANCHRIRTKRRLADSGKVVDPSELLG